MSRTCFIYLMKQSWSLCLHTAEEEAERGFVCKEKKINNALFLKEQRRRVNLSTYTNDVGQRSPNLKRSEVTVLEKMGFGSEILQRLKMCVNFTGHFFHSAAVTPVLPHPVYCEQCASERSDTGTKPAGHSDYYHM